MKKKKASRELKRGRRSGSVRPKAKEKSTAQIALEHAAKAYEARLRGEAIRPEVFCEGVCKWSV
jgi:hypothetical protein